MAKFERRWLLLDSQSGKHVPIHDESHVSLWLQPPGDITPQTVSKWAKEGLSGVMLDSKSCDDPSLLMRTVNGNESSLPEVLEQFEFWLPHDHAQNTISDKASNVVYQVDFHTDNPQPAQDAVANLVHQQLRSAIACRASESSSMLTLATGVASLIDATHGGDYVYLMGEHDDMDSLVELAEELGYLDVEGPTLKARMVVDLATATTTSAAVDGVEECLMMGINKFVIEPDRLKWMADFVQGHGKTCNVKGGQ